MKRRASKKKGSSSGAASTSASKPLKLTLPARCNITGTSSNPQVAEVVQHGSNPATAILPVSEPLPAVVVEPFVNDCIPLEHMDVLGQELEILAVANVNHNEPVTPPAAKLLADFFTLEDSQDEGEATPLAPKAKQSKKSLAKASAKLDEKAQRKSLSLAPISITHSYVSPLTGIVLLIPQSSGASDKRKTLAPNISYEEALTTIYVSIGCEGVKKKPDLSYMLSNAAQKASPVGLSCEDNWEGLCEEVVNCQTKKKTTIAVSILVSEQVCLPFGILSFKVTYHVP